MAIDYWCNLFTPDGLRKTFEEPEEIASVVKWWGLKVQSHSVPDFVEYMDRSGMEAVMIPAAKMNSWLTQKLIWDLSEEEVLAVCEQAPGRIFGLIGIDPREGMQGVRKLAKWGGNPHFVGAHLHPYGFGLEVNHRRYYPFYAKCIELDLPLVVQIGHSAEQMPSAMGRPILLDDIALELPELRIVAAHTGWPWVEELTALAWKHRNVYIGTSAHFPKYWDKSLVSFANSRGRGKVLFGTDWPVMDHGDAIAAVKNLGLREDAEELLLSGAAKQVFKLEGRVGSPTTSAR
ncbi:MAG TPA: amidohydrolase family protein [Candidatus Dormibacteraeota bacterium]|nr:amidohydrolase family protein [Candidatus Dormibacteraeota bacterium]